MRVTWWCALVLAVCPVVARSADAPSRDAPSPEARFAQRLESQVHLALPGRPATDTPFLCFSDVDIGEIVEMLLRKAKAGDIAAVITVGREGNEPLSSR